MPNLPGSLPPGVVDALRRGNKVEAIKLLREATGLGLAEAKGLVDHHESGGRVKVKVNVVRRTAAPQAAARAEGLGPGEEPRSSSHAAAILIVLAIAGFILWGLYSRFG